MECLLEIDPLKLLKVVGKIGVLIVKKTNSYLLTSKSIAKKKLIKYVLTLNTQVPIDYYQFIILILIASSMQLPYNTIHSQIPPPHAYYTNVPIVRKTKPFQPPRIPYSLNFLNQNQPKIVSQSPMQNSRFLSPYLPTVQGSLMTSRQKSLSHFEKPATIYLSNGTNQKVQVYDNNGRPIDINLNIVVNQNEVSEVKSGENSKISKGNQDEISYNYHIQQSDIYCVICNKNYKSSDRQTHLQIHKRNYSSKNTDKFLKTFAEVQKPKLIVKPIVEPEQYNIKVQNHVFQVTKSKQYISKPQNKINNSQYGIQYQNINLPNQVIKSEDLLRQTFHNQNQFIQKQRSLYKSSEKINNEIQPQKQNITTNKIMQSILFNHQTQKQTIEVFNKNTSKRKFKDNIHQPNQIINDIPLKIIVHQPHQQKIQQPRVHYSEISNQTQKNNLVRFQRQSTIQHNTQPFILSEEQKRETLNSRKYQDAIYQSQTKNPQIKQTNSYIKQRQVNSEKSSSQINQENQNNRQSGPAQLSFNEIIGNNVRQSDRPSTVRPNQQRPIIKQQRSISSVQEVKPIRKTEGKKIIPTQQINNSVKAPDLLLNNIKKKKIAKSSLDSWL